MSRRIDRTIRPTAFRANSDTQAAAGPAKLVIVTRHELIAAGIEVLLRAGGHRVLARVKRGDDLLRCLELYRPDTLLLNMIRHEAVRLISQLRPNHRSISIILMLEERDVITPPALLELDVQGILLSAACASGLLHCVESVRRGGRWIDPDLLRYLASAGETKRMANRLTKREADIANLVSLGLHNKQIARELHLSEGTVKMHLHHIYEKLHLRGRTELALSVAGEAGPGTRAYESDEPP
jgi:two-component system nitrate/nitrite response regulator NarL